MVLVSCFADALPTGDTKSEPAQSTRADMLFVYCSSYSFSYCGVHSRISSAVVVLV